MKRIYYDTYRSEKEAVFGKNEIAWVIWDTLGKLNILNDKRKRHEEYMDEKKSFEENLISLLEELKNTAPLVGNRIQKQILHDLAHIQKCRVDCRFGVYVYCKTTPFADEKTSSGEKEVMRFLDGQNIKYLRQYDTLLCINPKTGHILPYDFELVGRKILIEVQGLQHYQYIPHFHHSEDEFKMRQEIDSYKRKFANNKGYQLIELSYAEIKSGEFRKTLLKHLE